MIYLLIIIIIIIINIIIIIIIIIIIKIRNMQIILFLLFALIERKEIFLFNDALDTFYLPLYGVGHMVRDNEIARGETR